MYVLLTLDANSWGKVPKKPPKTVVGPSQGGEEMESNHKGGDSAQVPQFILDLGGRIQLLMRHLLMMVFRPRAEREGDTVPSAHHSSKWFLPLTCTSSVIRVSLQQFPASSLLLFMNIPASRHSSYIYNTFHF